MTQIHSIELKDITFGEPSEAFTAKALAFPIYGNLIDDTVLSAEQRAWIQLEPAFQFLNEGDPDRYEFGFEIATAAAFFASTPQGQPIFREATGAALPAGIGIDFPDAVPGRDPSLKRCRVSVVPASWGKAPRVLTLRIFCNDRFGSAEYDGLHGVSLSLVVGGGETLAAGANLLSPLRGKELPIVVALHEAGGRTLPKFDVFRDFPLPPGLSLEPAFRLSQNRPAATVKLSLQDPQLSFEAPQQGEDEVTVLLRSADRPGELSRVQTTENRSSVLFTWQKASAEKAIVCGFSFRVGKAGKGHDHWQQIRGLDVDPIVYHDPPPAGL